MVPWPGWQDLVVFQVGDLILAPFVPGASITL